METYSGYQKNSKGKAVSDGLHLDKSNFYQKDYLTGDSRNYPSIFQLKRNSSAQTSVKQLYNQRVKPENMKKANHTGLPNKLKSQAENISGFSMEDVRVHYNSQFPKKIGALAYTHGTNIYVAPGQEKHLGHETGHVVQQKQGRVPSQLKMNNLNLNTDAKLEREADLFSAQTSLLSIGENTENQTTKLAMPDYTMNTVQLMKKIVFKSSNEAESIWLDKEDKHYYNGLKNEGAFFKPVVLEKAPIISDKGSLIPEEQVQSVPIIVDPYEIKSGTKIITPKRSEKGRYGLDEIVLKCKDERFVEANKDNPRIVTFKNQLADNAVRSERYYAEGDMSHAIARSMGYQKGNVQEPYGPQKDPSIPTVVKATEFRSLKKVSKESPLDIDPIKGLNNLEVSFDGSTGDMTHAAKPEKKEKLRRKYDSLQATFFWIPKTEIEQELRSIRDERYKQKDKFYIEVKALNTKIQNIMDIKGKWPKQLLEERDALRSRCQECYVEIGNLKGEIGQINYLLWDLVAEEKERNADCLSGFLIAAEKKVKDSGEIRIVLMDLDPYTEVIEKVIDTTRTEKSKVEYIGCIIPKEGMYQNYLYSVGLNEKHRFQHQLTDGGYFKNKQDIIYVFRKKPLISKAVPIVH